jgi:hypothetical protein
MQGGIQMGILSASCTHVIRQVGGVRMRKIMLISVVAAALAIIVFLASSMLSYLFFPSALTLKVGEVERERLINFATSRGYRVCGEVTLNYGETSRTVFTKIISAKAACIILFNLPEPKDDYIIYDPVVRLIIAPLKEEDMHKAYRYSWTSSITGGVIYEMMDENLRRSMDEGVGVRGGITYFNLQPMTGFSGVRGRDIFVALLYEPPASDPNMSINVTIIVDAAVLRHGEKYESKTPPLEPPRDKGWWESMIERLDRDLEVLGYSKCSEHYLGPGRHSINLTLVFNPSEGRACYVKILPKELLEQKVRVLGGRYSFGIALPGLDLYKGGETWVADFDNMSQIHVGGVTLNVSRADAEEMLKRVRRAEATIPLFFDPFTAFMMSDPAYEKYRPEELPRAFSWASNITGLFLNETNSVGEGGYQEGIYIIFYLRVTPPPKLSPELIARVGEPKAVYEISLDVEVGGR